MTRHQRLAALLFVAAALLAPTRAQQPATGVGAAPTDDPRAVQVLDAVRDRYGKLTTFYARYRQVDHTYGEWQIREELRLWEEMRKRPNMLWIETGFVQELPEFGLSAEQRLMGETAPLTAPPQDGALRHTRIQCNGQVCWHEYFSLYALKSPAGTGQFDTENMAVQDVRKLLTLKPGQPWPSEPEPDLPIVVGELLDRRDVKQRLVPGSLKLLVGKGEDGKETLTESISCMTRESGETRECSHIVFLLTNGLEQHWWVDTESSMIRSERVFRTVAPAKDPFLELSPKVTLPADLTPAQMDRVQRVRRYMTGRYTRSDLFYDYLQWDFDSPDGDYEYRPDDPITIVGPNEISPMLDKLYEMSTGEPARPPAPPAPDAQPE